VGLVGHRGSGKAAGALVAIHNAERNAEAVAAELSGCLSPAASLSGPVFVIEQQKTEHAASQQPCPATLMVIIECCSLQ
jgi:hypothetical protein